MDSDFYRREFRHNPLAGKSILEMCHLKNACGGDARTLEDCGFLTCIDLFTYWFYDRENLEKIIRKPILPWQICDLTEGFEERIQDGNGSEAKIHLENVLRPGNRSVLDEAEIEESECSGVFDELKSHVEFVEAIEKLHFKTFQNVFTFWNYEKEQLTQILAENQVPFAEIFEKFEKIKSENPDLAWKHLDSSLRKRTTFISHLLI